MWPQNTVSIEYILGDIFISKQRLVLWKITFSALKLIYRNSLFFRAAQKLGKKKKRHQQQEPDLPLYPTKYNEVIKNTPPPAPPCLLRAAGRLQQPGIGKVMCQYSVYFWGFAVEKNEGKNRKSKLKWRKPFFFKCLAKLYSLGLCQSGQSRFLKFVDEHD